MKTKRLALWIVLILVIGAALWWLTSERTPPPNQSTAAIEGLPASEARNSGSDASSRAENAVEEEESRKAASADSTPLATSPNPGPITAATPDDTAEVSARKSAELLSGRVELSDPDKRAELVAKLRAIENEKRAAIAEKAARLGFLMEVVEPDGTKLILVGFDGDLPLYEADYNTNAAISTAANLVRSAPPYNAEGSGLVFGLWEVGGVPRISHQEFGVPSKVVVRDGSSSASDHATHVAGTLAALGVNPSALGMAPGAGIDAYDSTDALSEMAGAGAAFPGEPGKLYVSNHSYGLILGWRPSTSTWYGSFTDNGDPSDDIDTRLGRYDATSVSYDGLLYNLPYYLPFWAAGNDRNDNPPAVGQNWFQGPGGTTRAYDPAQHPVGDGLYKAGYDLLEYRNVCKNLMTVGAANDAVTAGLRNPGAGTLTVFSSTGPTDDGRIKPDIVANGATLYSSGASSDLSYYNSSGTSMASPNAAGSAMLLVDYYRQRFPGQAMRASTLKGLIIHTADDIGRPGPDYEYGWGLMNTKAAADLIKEQADIPGSEILTERLLTNGGSQVVTFTWDGVSPIRATLCWTDPPGEGFSTHDNLTPDLTNDLNLKITGPDSNLHLPFAMPYVGDWSNAMLTAPAVRGVNHVDNVEQVLVDSPVPGLYTITVDHVGSLTGGEQHYSLIVSGGGVPDTLAILPISGLTASGDEGGPFSPDEQVFTLVNNDSAATDWTASVNQTWVDLSNSGGSIPAGASATVTASFNSLANSLIEEVHQAVITIADTTSGAIFERQVSLQVGIVDYFTELFDAGGPHDLDNRSFVFTPSPTRSGYTVVQKIISSFPTDPSGGTAISLGDDSFSQVTLSGGSTVELYDVSYGSFFVGSNGFITFGSGSSGFSESFANHFSLPRVSGLFDDLNPAAGGQVTRKQLADRIAITWSGVPQFNTSDSNNFQIELFFDGRITITHLSIAATDGMIGLSEGLGLPTDFEESDFSSYPSSPPTPAELFTSAMTSAGLSGDAAAPGATPFDDGVTNLLKYAFHMNLGGPDAHIMPASGGTSGLPLITLEPTGAGTGVLHVQFVRRVNSGLVYTPKMSPSLEAGSWESLTVSPTVTPINDDWESVHYAEPVSFLSTPLGFGVVEVSLH